MNGYRFDISGVISFEILAVVKIPSSVVKLGYASLVSS